jgi:uncharacterized membrane protein YfcA
MTWQFALTGLFVGILVGLTGMGGGSLMTPILVFALGFSPTMAIGTDIAHGAIFKSVGAIRQRTLGNVKARLSGWMLLGSAPMSLAGVAVATLLERRYGDSVESTGAKVLGAALLLGGLGLLAKTLFVGDTVRVDSFRLTNRDRVVAFAIGFFGGFIVGLTSVGSGVFFGLTMLLAFPLKSAKVVGTDIFHAAALLWVAGLGHFVAGNVDLSAVGWLLIGSIPGVLIGSQFTIKVPDRALRGILSGVLVLSGIKLLDVPGSTVIVVVALCGGFVAGLVILAIEFVRRRRADRIAVAEPAPAVLRLETGEE